MSDVIDTKSRLFKLYAARRVRKGPCWSVEDVLEDDVDYINICSYTRNIVLEVMYHVMIALAKLVGGLIIGFLLMAPILSVGAWLLTDNPFIFWFGKLGEIACGVDVAIIAVVLFILGMSWLDEKRIDITKSTKDAVKTMSASSVFIKWVKAKHGKFCHRLTFDRKSTNPTEEELQDPDWPRE